MPRMPHTLSYKELCTRTRATGATSRGGQTRTRVSGEVLSDFSPYLDSDLFDLRQSSSRTVMLNSPLCRELSCGVTVDATSHSRESVYKYRSLYGIWKRKVNVHLFALKKVGFAEILYHELWMYLGSTSTYRL
ncbi:hypothetical protein J6590_041668 [Homalodisca vitripennis]|nr:hypothetical protein J6590_041668 [Homalodisca vitripennis]